MYRPLHELINQSFIFREMCNTWIYVYKLRKSYMSRCSLGRYYHPLISWNFRYADMRIMYHIIHYCNHLCCNDRLNFHLINAVTSNATGRTYRKILPAKQSQYIKTHLYYWWYKVNTFMKLFSYFKVLMVTISLFSRRFRSRTTRHNRSLPQTIKKHRADSL